jgi:hypothetical protein
LIAVARHFAPLTNGGRRWLDGVDARIEHEPNQKYQNLLAIAPQPQGDELDLAVLMRSLPVAVLRRM